MARRRWVRVPSPRGKRRGREPEGREEKIRGEEEEHGEGGLLLSLLDSAARGIASDRGRHGAVETGTGEDDRVGFALRPLELSLATRLGPLSI